MLMHGCVCCLLKGTSLETYFTEVRKVTCVHIRLLFKQKVLKLSGMGHFLFFFLLLLL